MTDGSHASRNHLICTHVVERLLPLACARSHAHFWRGRWTKWKSTRRPKRATYLSVESVREGPKKGAFYQFPTFGRLGRRRMAGGLEVRLGWSAVPVSRPPPVFLNRCASVIGLIS